MGHPPISKIAKGFRLHPSPRNEANNIDSLSQMQAKKIKKNHVWLFWFFVAELPQPPGGGKLKSAIAQPGQPTKKKRNYILNFFLLHCHLECLSVCGQYRPNRAPNPESAVGSRVRPARQSRDCLRGRPLRTPVLSAMVCSAYGVGTAHPCTGAYGVTRRIPAPPETFLSA